MVASKLFVLVPVYNEQGTIEDVLSRLNQLDGTVAEVVVVDDGSSDGSGPLIDRWAASHPNVTVFRHETNQGYSQALLTGFDYLVQRMDWGDVSDQDVLATVDADGQHDPLELPRLWQAMQADNLDVVWGQRDFSLYPWWKRLGNRMMSLMSWVFSGYRFTDVESGYCLFRVGALSTALKYRTRDWRYSISLTLAVILTRLGYRLSNEPKVSVAVYRSRTRMLDVFTDTMAAANAWAAVTFFPLRHSVEARLRFGVSLATALAAMLILVLVAIKPIFLGYDSINNYIHVRFIAQSLFHSGAIPLRLPWLENGQALTYPYAFFPWTLGALFYPAFGNYAVTWLMILGAVLLVWVVYKTRLESDRWLLILFILHPFLLEGLLSFQLAFIWTSLFAYLYIHAVERNARWWAWLWLVLALSTHLLVIGSLLVIYDLYVWFFHKERRRTMLLVGLLSLPVVAPVAWYTLQAPSIAINSRLSLLLDVSKTVFIRALLFFSPFLLVKAKGFFSGRPMAVPAAVCLAMLSVVNAIPFAAPPIRFSGFGMVGSFGGLVTAAGNPYRDFLASDAFQPGAIYRILEASDQEQGHYFLVEHGAILSHELFSESQTRITWRPAVYPCFISAKKIDFIVVNAKYQGMFHTNEEQLLEGMVAAGVAQLHYADLGGRFKVYDVRQVRADEPGSVKSCFES